MRTWTDHGANLPADCDLNGETLPTPPEKPPAHGRDSNPRRPGIILCPCQLNWDFGGAANTRTANGNFGRCQVCNETDRTVAEQRHNPDETPLVTSSTVDDPVDTTQYKTVAFESREVKPGVEVETKWNFDWLRAKIIGRNVANPPPNTVRLEYLDEDAVEDVEKADWRVRIATSGRRTAARASTASSDSAEPFTPTVQHGETLHGKESAGLVYDPEAQKLGGTPIRAGEVCSILTGAATRDPRVFDEPDRFDIQRRSTPHFGFGGGSHVCLGASLARSELQIMFSSLIARFPKLELGDGPLAYRDSLVLRGLKRLPLRL